RRRHTSFSRDWSSDVCSSDLRRRARPEPASLDGVEAPRDLRGNVLIIGFGRVGQIASQSPLARGAELSIIDNDPDVIRNAARYEIGRESCRETVEGREGHRAI